MHAVVGEWFASRLAPYLAFACVTSAGVVLGSSASCKDPGTIGVGGGGGEGGAGGARGCPEDETAPLFTLHVLTKEPSLPEDLELSVSWSGGDEPVVLIADPSTYGTIEDNVVCIRKKLDDGGGGGAGGYGESGAEASSTGGDGGAPPSDELLCELWTSGPTRVRIDATDFVPIDETLAPATTDGCDRPVASEVEIELVVDEPEEDEAAPAG